MDRKTLKELCIEYDKCDSVIQRNLLSESIVSLVENYLSKLYSDAMNIMGSTKNTIFAMTDYLPDRGHTSIYEIYEDKVSVKYSDLWGHGGSCKEVFSVNFGEYEKFDEESHIKNLKRQKNDSLKFRIKFLENEIVLLRKDLAPL
jgi:hypothetical protein